MYSIVFALIDIIKSINATDIFLYVVEIILYIASLVLSVICTKRCEEFYQKDKKISMLLTVIFPLWTGIGNIVYIKQVLKTAPKTCNKCGFVTQARYTVCRNCKSVNDFTSSDERIPKISEAFKNKILPFAVGAIVTGAVAMIIRFITNFS
ncbi:MAG: hypothetical protein J1E36_02565 [Eubacterium sp.]|nr:hypothetical protein [Eubacterium sp.]